MHEAWGLLTVATIVKEEQCPPGLQFLEGVVPFEDLNMGSFNIYVADERSDEIGIPRTEANMAERVLRNSDTCPMHCVATEELQLRVISRASKQRSSCDLTTKKIPISFLEME